MRRWRGSPISTSSPRTRAEIDRLLRQGALLETPTCSVRTIERAAYWPDCIKTLGERFSYASPWHYQNVDICRPFDPRRGLPRRQLRLGADRAAAAPARRPAGAGARAADGARLPRPFHGRPPPADARRRPWRPRRQPGPRPPTGSSRPTSTPPGTAISPTAASPSRRAARAGMLSELGAGRQGGDARGRRSPTGRAKAGRRAASSPTARSSPIPAARRRPSRPVITEEMTRRLVPVVRRQVARGGLRLARLLDEAFAPDSVWLRPSGPSRAGACVIGAQRSTPPSPVPPSLR